jgi:NlpC/P60 family protein
MRKPSWRTIREALITVTCSVIAVGCIYTAPQAQAATTTPGASALAWAETQYGKPYVWGGTGPYGYDCSGLVVEAFMHVGIVLPHSTTAMLSSPELHYVAPGDVQPGDLAFYGSGHVEFVTAWPHTTFGAHDFDQPVGWIKWGPWWYPTMFFRVQ